MVGLEGGAVSYEQGTPVKSCAEKAAMANLLRAFKMFQESERLYRFEFAGQNTTWKFARRQFALAKS